MATKWERQLIAVVCSATVLILSCSWASAASTLLNGCENGCEKKGTVTTDGGVHNIQFQITVPANWNGTVINDLDRVGSNSRANALLPLGYAYTGTARASDRGQHWDPSSKQSVGMD